MSRVWPRVKRSLFGFPWLEMRWVGLIHALLAWVEMMRSGEVRGMNNQVKPEKKGHDWSTWEERFNVLSPVTHM